MYFQLNVALRKKMNAKEWKETCASSEYKTPSIGETGFQQRKSVLPKRKRSDSKVEIENQDLQSATVENKSHLENENISVEGNQTLLNNNHVSPKEPEIVHEKFQNQIIHKIDVSDSFNSSINVSEQNHNETCHSLKFTQTAPMLVNQRFLKQSSLDEIKTPEQNLLVSKNTASCEQSLKKDQPLCLKSDTPSKLPMYNTNKSLEKPDLPMVFLIGYAIINLPQQKAQLKAIFKWISDNFPYYQLDNKKWQVS